MLSSIMWDLETVSHTLNEVQLENIQNCAIIILTEQTLLGMNIVLLYVLPLQLSCIRYLQNWLSKLINDATLKNDQGNNEKK